VPSGTSDDRSPRARSPTNPIDARCFDGPKAESVFLDFADVSPLEEIGLPVSGRAALANALRKTGAAP